MRSSDISEVVQTDLSLHFQLGRNIVICFRERFLLTDRIKDSMIKIN